MGLRTRRRSRMSPLGWLLRVTFVSIFGSFIAVRGTKYLFGEATGLVPDLAQAGVGILTWTAITTKAGMHGMVRRMRSSSVLKMLERL